MIIIMLHVANILQVMLTHANLVANMAQLNHPALDLMEDGETTICVLPLFHIFAMNVTMSNMLLNGGKLVTLPSFDPGEGVFKVYTNFQCQDGSNYSQIFTECSGQFLDAMLEHRPTFLHVAPPLVTLIRCLHKKRPYLDYQMLLDDHDDHAKANVKLTTKILFRAHLFGRLVSWPRTQE